jgi:hypothetical protein
VYVVGFYQTSQLRSTILGDNLTVLPASFRGFPIYIILVSNIDQRTNLVGKGGLEPPTNGLEGKIDAVDKLFSLCLYAALPIELLPQILHYRYSIY